MGQVTPLRIFSCNIHFFLKLGNRKFREVILFFLKTSRSKVQFDANTYKSLLGTISKD